MVTIPGSTRYNFLGELEAFFREGSEIDFIFSKGTDRTLVEVCTEPDADHRTKIKKALKEIRGNKAVIITLNGKEVFGDPINEIPLHKWLNSPVA